jgi:hypothetical protein
MLSFEVTVKTDTKIRKLFNDQQFENILEATMLN